MLKSYRASCHCSRVQIEVGLDLSQAQLSLQLLHLQTQPVLARHRQPRKFPPYYGREGTHSLCVWLAKEPAFLLQALRHPRLWCGPRHADRPDVRHQYRLPGRSVGGGAFANSHHLCRWHARSLGRDAGVFLALVAIELRRRLAAASCAEKSVKKASIHYQQSAASYQDRWPLSHQGNQTS